MTLDGVAFWKEIDGQGTDGAHLYLAVFVLVSFAGLPWSDDKTK